MKIATEEDYRKAAPEVRERQVEDEKVYSGLVAAAFDGAHDLAEVGTRLMGAAVEFSLFLLQKRRPEMNEQERKEATHWAFDAALAEPEYHGSATLMATLAALVDSLPGVDEAYRIEESKAKILAKLRELSGNAFEEAEADELEPDAPAGTMS